MTHELRGARVLVTGAHGFVGRHAVSRLHRLGAHVTALGRAQCDLTDQAAVTAAVARARPDALLHLAAARDASSASARSATAAVNTMSGLWLVDALPDSCRVAVRLGSSTEYAAGPVAMDESSPLQPRGFFGHTKAAGSLLFGAAATARGVNHCVLRAFQVYGPGDKPTRFVPVVMTAARTGDPVPLTAPGMSRDWVWVGDVLDACLAALCRPSSKNKATVINIGTGIQTTNEALVSLASTATGRSISVDSGGCGGREWDTDNWCCDPGLAERELGWRPTVSLLDGLERCWRAAA